MTTNVNTKKTFKFGARRRQFAITGEYNNIFNVQILKKKKSSVS